MDSSSRRPLCDHDDLEEGEYVPGHYHSSSDSDDTDDDDRFDHQSRRDDDDEVHPKHGGGRMRRLEDIVDVAVGRAGAGAPLPASPMPSSESEGTISDDGGARKFACHVCDKGFSSRKAVDGHMRVHGSGSGSGSGRHVHVAATATAAVTLSGGWAVTGRRGSTGGKLKPSAAAGSLNSESTGHSMAIVAVQQVKPLEPVEPVPMAFAAVTNPSPMPSSTRTNLSGEDDEGSSATANTATAQPMHYDEPVAAVAAAVVTVGANPSSTVAAAGARAAGPIDVEHQLAAASDQAPAPQVHCQAVSVPPPAAQKAHFAQQPLVVPPPPEATVQLQQGGQLVVPDPVQPPREYSCKVCGKTYSTHQGLGGHAAGHRNRQREQEAMAAAAGHGGGDSEFLAALRRGRKAEEPHVCQKCNKVFATGVALGGHMRMHYTGPPIVHKSKKRCVALVPAVQPPAPVVSEADLRLALSAAMEASSSTAPAVAGTGRRLRLFGIDIGPLGRQAPSEQQGSGTTAEGSSSAGEQQNK